MPTKKELLKNLRDYSPEQIADAVRSGVVSMYELTKETSGAFTPLLRKQVEAILATPIPLTNIKSEESAFQKESAPEIPVVSLFDATSDTSNPSSVTETTNPYEDEIEPKPKMFSRPFSFKGRIRRLEYGLSLIIYMIVFFIAEVMWESVIDSNFEDTLLLLLYVILHILLCWFTWAQGAKRCHDRGNSGWYQLIPFYGFVLLFGNGEKGTNSYGVSPK